MPELPKGVPPLTGYRVLDVTDEKGAFAARMLGDMGAEVIRVERLEGDPMRRLPPFAGDEPHPEKSLFFLYYNANKKSITLNLDSESGRDILRKLVAKSDVLIETYNPGYLDNLGLGYSALEQINPGLIMCSITSFGLDGAYRDYRGSELVNFALGGIMHYSGPPAGPPCAAPVPLAYHTTSIYAPLAIMIALYDRMTTGLGQYIDASVYDCMISAGDGIASTYAHEGRMHRRTPRASMLSGGIYACKDGYVYFRILSEHWHQILEWIGKPEPLLNPIWENANFRIANPDLVDLYMEQFCARYTKAELSEEGQRRKIPVLPVNSPMDFADDIHENQRGFFTTLEHPAIGDLRFPGAPYRLSKTPAVISAAAPLLGQHNEEIYQGLLGLGQKDLSALKGAGVI